MTLERRYSLPSRRLTTLYRILTNLQLYKSFIKDALGLTLTYSKPNSYSSYYIIAKYTNRNVYVQDIA